MHYCRCAHWEQEGFARVVTDYEIARGFEKAYYVIFPKGRWFIKGRWLIKGLDGNRLRKIVCEKNKIDV